METQAAQAVEQIVFFCNHSADLFVNDLEYHLCLQELSRCAWPTAPGGPCTSRRATEQISAGDLSRRIAGIATRDEVQELADTFNTMLARLQDSFEGERQFTSDASHELRTPIAVISACAEELHNAVSNGENAETLAVIQKESARMSKIISQLLLLTWGYEGRYHLEKEELDLCETVGSVLDERLHTFGYITWCPQAVSSLPTRA